MVKLTTALILAIIGLIFYQYHHVTAVAKGQAPEDSGIKATWTYCDNVTEKCYECFDDETPEECKQNNEEWEEN